MVAVPGPLDVNIQGAILDHCENAGDRFAILDGQRTSTLTVNDIQGTVRDSNYAAMYFPWINVFDPVTSANDFMPPAATWPVSTLGWTTCGAFTKLPPTR
jgi:hypothetical protein